MTSPFTSTGRLIGYARSSAPDDDISRQERELRDAGCVIVYLEGQDQRRPRLASCLRDLERGDTLVVTGFTKLGRTVSHLHDMVERLNCQGVSLRSLHENFDTSARGMRPVLHFLSQLASFEHDLAQERSRRSIAAARERGTTFGNPRFRNGDRDAIARMKETQDATFLERARIRSRPWIGHVVALRPAHSWKVVHRYVSSRIAEDQVPTVETMVSIVHRLVRAGDLPRTVLQRASATPRDVRDLALHVVRDQPTMGAEAVAAEFRRLEVAGRCDWTTAEVVPLLGSR